MEALKKLAMEQKQMLKNKVKEMQKEIGKIQKKCSRSDFDVWCNSRGKNEEKEKEIEKDAKKEKDHEKNQHDQAQRWVS